MWLTDGISSPVHEDFQPSSRERKLNRVGKKGRLHYFSRVSTTISVHTSSGLVALSCASLGRSPDVGDFDVVSSSESAIFCRFLMGGDTEESSRRLRAAGAYLSIDRCFFLSFLEPRLGLRERCRSALGLRVRPRPRLLLRGYRRLFRSLLRLRRRSSRDLRALPISARVSFLSSLAS